MPDCLLFVGLLLDEFIRFLVSYTASCGIPRLRYIPFGFTFDGFGIVIYRFRLSVLCEVAGVPDAVIIAVDEHSEVITARLDVEKFDSSLAGRYLLDYFIISVEELGNDVLPCKIRYFDEQRTVIVGGMYFETFFERSRSTTVNIDECGTVYL